MATGCPDFVQGRLDQLTLYVSPLLASPLVGEGGAFEAALALARCLQPPALVAAAVPIAAALRLVHMSAATGALAACPHVCCTGGRLGLQRRGKTQLAFVSRLEAVLCASAGSPSARTYPARDQVQRAVHALTAATVDGEPLPGQVCHLDSGPPFTIPRLTDLLN